MKICPVGTELFHADRQKDGRTERHDEATFFFCNFAKATKNNLKKDFVAQFIPASNQAPMVHKPTW
jgi:hypothetical protein